MSKVQWGTLPREYEAGIDRGMYYPPAGPGVAWNGLVSVIGSPSDFADGSTYYDGVKIPRRQGRESFNGEIRAMTAPDSFFEDILLQKRQKTFGMSYRTQHGDRYQLHIVYNVLLANKQAEYNQDPAEPFGWGFTTLPVPVEGGSHSAHLIIDSAIAYPWTVSAIEDILYGSDENAPRIPTPSEMILVFEENAILRIIDNGDGSWTAIGPDEAIVMLDETTFEITWPSAVYISEDRYTIHSL